MAVLVGPGNAVKVWSVGAGLLQAVIELKNVNSGDTLDLGAPGINLFQRIYGAGLLATSGASFGGTATATFVGTVITIPAGQTGVTALLTVLGVAV